jgi:hypothetical protein
MFAKEKNKNIFRLVGLIGAMLKNMNDMGEMVGILFLKR